MCIQHLFLREVKRQLIQNLWNQGDTSARLVAFHLAIGENSFGRCRLLQRKGSPDPMLGDSPSEDPPVFCYPVLDVEDVGVNPKDHEVTRWPKKNNKHFHSCFGKENSSKTQKITGVTCEGYEPKMGFSSFARQCRKNPSYAMGAKDWGTKRSWERYNFHPTLAAGCINVKNSFNLKTSSSDSGIFFAKKPINQYLVCLCLKPIVEDSFETVGHSTLVCLELPV